MYVCLSVRASCNLSKNGDIVITLCTRISRQKSQDEGPLPQPKHAINGKLLMEQHW